MRRGPVAIAVPMAQLVEAESALVSQVNFIIPIRTDSWFPIEATISNALEIADKQPFETVVITDSAEYLQEAIPTRVGTIFIGIPGLEVLPDHHAASWDLAVSPPGGVPGWYGELVLSDVRPGTPIASRGGFLIVNTSVALPGEATGRTIILGRSFPRSDARSDKHQYSQRILRLKANGDLERFARGLVPLLLWLKSHGGVDLVTRVPPRAGHDDPLGIVVGRATAMARVSCALDILERVRDYIPQKEIGDYGNRRINVQGAFRAADIPAGTRVALIDDIYTSGSTVLECARALVVSGASHVDLVAFGKNQHLITASVDSSLRCPDCNEPMRLRISSNDKAYWQCKDWRNCGKRQYYDVGLHSANELNRRSGDDAEDIEF
jgi:hypothetical protein